MDNYDEHVKNEKDIRKLRKKTKKEIVRTMVDWKTIGCPEVGHRCSKCGFKYVCDKMAGLLLDLKCMDE